MGGFEPQVKEILDWVPKQRQVSMFTATWPAGIRKLADTYIYNPVQVQIGGAETKACDDISQHIEILDNKDKTQRLKELLQEFHGNAVLVFCNTKRKCGDLAWEIQEAVALHGDLKQPERDAAIEAVKTGTKTVLIATDVASRGLDVRQIRCVINYDAPNKCEEDYVHRIGRTGRAGDKGDAYTFLSWGEEKQAEQICAVMENGNLTPPECLREM